MKPNSKITTLQLFVVCLIVLIGATKMTHSQALEEAPIDFHLSQLGILLDTYANLPHGGNMAATSFQTGLTSCKILWVKPFKKTPKKHFIAFSYEDVLNKIEVFSKDSLPKQINPKIDNLIGVYQFYFEDSGWIWFFDFKVIFDELLAGAGYKPNLIIPVTIDGLLLIEAECK